MTFRRTAPVLALLLAVGVPAAADEGAPAGDAVLEVLGNPIAQATVAAPTGPVPVPVTEDRPRGTTPATHVYVDSAGGAPSAYLTAQLRLPAGERTAALDLVLVDDPDDPQDVAADTALLQACVVLGTLDAAAPDDPAELDCTAAVRGVRTAGADGAGTWTFGLQGLSDRVGSDGALGVAVTTVPGAGTAASVAFLRDSVRFPYVLRPPGTGGTAGGEQAPVSNPPPGSASDTDLLSSGPSEVPQAFAPPPGPGVATEVEDPVAELPTVAPAPQVAPAVVLDIRPQAASAVPAPRGGPRPLLLLLVPLVPLLVLRAAGAVGPEPDREPDDGTDDPYPGLRRRAG